MDLALNTEHKAFADEIRAFARENLSPATREKTFSGKHYDRDDHMVWQQALGKKGWLAYTWPKKYGGPGWSLPALHQRRQSSSTAFTGSLPSAVEDAVTALR